MSADWILYEHNTLGTRILIKPHVVDSTLVSVRTGLHLGDPSLWVHHRTLARDWHPVPREPNRDVPPIPTKCFTEGYDPAEARAVNAGRLKRVMKGRA